MVERETENEDAPKISAGRRGAKTGGAASAENGRRNSRAKTNPEKPASEPEKEGGESMTINFTIPDWLIGLAFGFMAAHYFLKIADWVVDKVGMWIIKRKLGPGTAFHERNRVSNRVLAIFKRRVK